MVILATLIMAFAIPGKASPGVLLPMLLFADVLAVIYYLRECQWVILLKIIPLTAIGIIIGYYIVDLIPIDFFEKLLGVLILSLLILDIALSNRKKDLKVGWISTSIIGVLAGIATMIANAAGPILGIYLLQMGMTKKEFIGTRSWFF